MVGTRLICALTGTLPPAAYPVAAPHGALTETQPWEAQTVWQWDRFCLGFWKYDAYPITSVETHEFCLYLEGRLYGLSGSQIPAELLKVAQRAASPDGGASALKNWLRDADGDFLIFIVHKKTNRIFFINDLFARLPVYYFCDGRILVLSRDLGYVLQHSQPAAFDPLSLSQYLLFGFPLGPRTLFKDIFSLPPATLITIEAQGSRLTMNRLLHHNLEDLPLTSPSISVNAGNLVDRFRIACANRASLDEANIVSLSGGLDSRAVAACLRHENLPLAAASFLDHQGKKNGDIQVARQVAAHLRLPWRSFQLPLPRQPEVDTLLRLKLGANNLEMSFILPFFNELINTFGAGLTYFTGDGGGDTLGESRPYRQLPDFSSLLAYLIERYQIFPLDFAASLTGIPASYLVTALADLVNSFPEKTPARKYQHFFCLEVAQKEYNEGEDRNRQYFWSVTPFYAPSFFTYALSCPDDQKSRLRLYQHFLASLSPGLEKIPYADWGAPLGSWKFLLQYAAKNISRRRPHLTRSLKRILAPTPGNATNYLPSQALKEQLLSCPNLGSVFSEAALKKLAGNLDTLNIRQQWTLFTLTSLVEKWGALIK